MKKKTNAVTINLPVAMHVKLCNLAGIAQCSIEDVILLELSHAVEQFYDGRDLECLIPFIEYDTYEQAAHAAEAANFFQDDPDGYVADLEPCEKGKFHVSTRGDMEEDREEMRKEVNKIIGFDFDREVHAQPADAGNLKPAG